MANTYTKLIYHLVWSTKKRAPLLRPLEKRERVWAYLAGISQQNKMFVHKVGGVEDHVHMLLEIPKNLTIIEAAKRIKGASSLWVNQEGIFEHPFYWQDGYGAFTVGITQVEKVKSYIENQPEHHRRVSFQEEYESMLLKAGYSLEGGYHLD